MADILHTIGGLYYPYDYEDVTVSSSVIGLTESKYKVDSEIGKNSIDYFARRAVITVEDAAFRYRYDGDDPTASVGHAAANGSVIVLVGEQAISQFKAIRTGGTDATLRVTYER